MLDVKLVSSTLDSLDLIESAASICYDSKPTKKHAIMIDCIENGHTSVTEYANFVFEVKGVSRALLAQITRHRVGVSFTVRSQRYCDEDKFNYVTPPSVLKDQDAIKKYDTVMETILSAYNDLKYLGVPKEDARYILPNACETTFYVQFNLRSFMHFCNERLCTIAQWEIRKLVNDMVKLILDKYPELQPYLVPKCEQYKIPFCSEKRGCGKHPNLTQI